MKLKKGFIVHCDTKEKARVFLDECKKQGFYDSYYDKHTDWEGHNKNTCYRICSKYEIRYGSKYGYFDKSRIIEFDDLFKEEKEMSKCKTYELPNYINSDVQKVIVNKPCVIVFLKTGEKGIAKCYPGDEFSEEQGYMIAYRRARIEKLKGDLMWEERMLKSCVEGDFL